jgi:hypothetical protein
MSVRDRIEDSRLLFAAGRLDGAFLMVLTAVAGSSRRRFPENSTWSRINAKNMMGSGEAFVEFLREEETRVPTGILRQIQFEGQPRTIADILWKYLRCDLSHEGELRERISVDYGDFLVDSRGTSDHLTFSSELLLRLDHLVVTAKENSDIFPSDRYSQLPEPLELKRAAMIQFTWGDQEHECLCHACSLVRDIWDEIGEMTEWLHIKAYQMMNGRIVGNQSLKLLVPAKYVTFAGEGPEFQLAKRRTSANVGVFPPNPPAPSNAMDVSLVRDAVAALQIDLIQTIVQLQRPAYRANELAHTNSIGAEQKCR